MTIKNKLKLLLFVVITASSFIMPDKIFAGIPNNGTLTITEVTAVKTYASADNTYDSGWKWTYNVTVPTNETALNMKFANWTSGSNNIPVASNARFYSSQSSNAADRNSAITINAADTYSSVMNINPASDLDDTTNGIQIQITVEFKVPVGSTDSTYSTTYGVQTIDPDIAFVATDKADLTEASIKGTNSDLSNITVGLTSPLPSSGSSGSTITWSSDTTSVVSNDGQTVNRPASTADNATVVLTATIIKGSVTDTKSFTLTVLKNIGIQATPTFDPTAGAIAFGTTVTINSAGADAIYYTTDGSDPTTSSTNQATTPLVVDSAMTVKALAVKAGYDNSEIGSASYTQATATVPSDVVLALGSTNSVGGVTNVAIPAAGATDTTGAITDWVTNTNDKIKFTVTDNGGSSTITINGEAYTSGADYTITSTDNLTIVVTTTETGKVTEVRTFTITVAPAPSQATPTFDPVAGAIAFGDDNVTITSAGADNIHYTTNGDDPTTSDPAIASGGTVTISSAVTLKALAIKAGYTNSAIGSASYTQAATADLSNIALSGSPTNYTFASGTYDYTEVTVLNDVSSITVTPTGSGTITVDGTPVTSGQASEAIALTGGVEKTITIIATETGKSAKTYTIKITKNVSIGDTYQGGIVAYIDGTGLHGLIAATTDQSTGVIWGCYGTAISGADGTAIGTGAQNTADILAGCATRPIAASLAANYDGGGYTDWYLPSKNELSQLYINIAAIGGFTTDYYWSSSEGDANGAWGRDFHFGFQGSTDKSYTSYVRAVRAF